MGWPLLLFYPFTKRRLARCIYDRVKMLISRQLQDDKRWLGTGLKQRNSTSPKYVNRKQDEEITLVNQHRCFLEKGANLYQNMTGTNTALLQ